MKKLNKATKVKLAEITIIVVALTLLVSIIIAVAPAIIDRINAPELYSSTMKADLLRGLEANNQEMLEYYKEAYIEKDIYLFNGPLTFNLMCEKYELDVELYTALYDDAEYSSIQDFYNDIVKDIVNK